MRAALTRCCAFGVALVAFAVLAAPALADPDVPTGLAAVAQSDHEVDLTWSWPANPNYPDDLQIWRNGVDIGSVPLTSTSYVDVAPSPATTYSYQLVTVNAGVPTFVGSPVTATTRQDLPNAPTNVAVTFDASNIADGHLDARRRRTPTSPTTSPPSRSAARRRRPRPSTTRRATQRPGSVTMDNFSSYTSYNFTVTAVETAGDPPSDPGGSVSAPVFPAMSLDVVKPQFSSVVVNANRTVPGSVSVSWPSATDAGSGVASYNVCVDGTNCKVEPFQALSQQQGDVFTGVADDGLSHPVTVTAVDMQGNVSDPLTASVVMPPLAPPAISLLPGKGDGCTVLSPLPVIPAIDGTQVGTVLYVNGAPWTSGNPVTGAPFSTVSLQMLTTFGLEQSVLSPPISALVGDLDGPSAAPVLHVFPDVASASATVQWTPITARWRARDAVQPDERDRSGLRGRGRPRRDLEPAGRDAPNLQLERPVLDHRPRAGPVLALRAGDDRQVPDQRQAAAVDAHALGRGPHPPEHLAELDAGDR